MFNTKRSILLLLLFSSTLAIATPQKQPTMAILPFQISPVVKSVEIGDLSITKTLVEREFSNELINFLTKSRKFNIITRTEIKKIMDENLLTESDWVDPKQAEKVGKLLVADFLVTGVINRLEFEVIRQNIKITGEVAPRIVATVKCQFQVIDTLTGKILLADQVINKLKSVDVRREIPISERKDWTLADYKDLLFEKSANQVGSAILAGVYPVKVIEVSKDSVLLNRGKGAGVSVGQKYSVESQEKSVTDIDTGESLGMSGETVAIVEITSVEVKFSKAKIVSLKGKLSVGNKCRLIISKESNQKPAYPKSTLGW